MQNIFTTLVKDEASYKNKKGNYIIKINKNSNILKKNIIIYKKKKKKQKIIKKKSQKQKKRKNYGKH